MKDQIIMEENAFSNKNLIPTRVYANNKYSKTGGLAQLKERVNGIREVVDSNPISSTTDDCASLCGRPPVFFELFEAKRESLSSHII